jgi:ribosomal protein S4
MNKENSVQNMMEKYQKLKESLIKIGLIQQGTILPRTIQKKTTKEQYKMKTYGPYNQWTRKIKGKTVTNNLTSSQAETYHKAIDEYKKLKNILSEMMELSTKILDDTTESVIKRK